MENTALKTQLGSNISRLRNEASLSQETLALMVGISRQYLIEIETGRANPTVTVLQRLADGLDVSVACFFEENKTS